MLKTQGKTFVKWDGGYYELRNFNPQLVIVRVLPGVVRVDYAGERISDLEASLAPDGYEIANTLLDPLKDEVERRLHKIKLRQERLIDLAIKKIKAINEYNR